MSKGHLGELRSLYGYLLKISCSVTAIVCSRIYHATILYFYVFMCLIDPIWVKTYFLSFADRRKNVFQHELVVKVNLTYRDYRKQQL